VDFTAEGFVEKAKAALDPKKPVLVYCRSGGRSAKAVKALREAGFTTVHDMDGGIIAWQKAGKPVEK
jgi:rhodanese-related sulfurtransferase